MVLNKGLFKTREMVKIAWRSYLEKIEWRKKCLFS